MKKEIIVNQLCASYGTNESSEVKLITDLRTGKSELVISKTITEYYKPQDYDKVMQLHENLNRGGGRRMVKLIDLTK